MIIKPITLQIEKRVWDEFKSITPRSIKLNDALVDVIEIHIKRLKK